MTRFVGTNGNMFAAQIIVRNDDQRLCDEAFYSAAWQVLGPDVLWARSAIIATPTSRGGSPFWGILTSWGDSWDPIPYMQSESKIGQKRDGLVGVTRDSSGNALGTVTVEAFDVPTLTLVDQTVSDANGNYQVTTPYTGQSMFVRALKTGSPDV